MRPLARIKRDPQCLAHLPVEEKEHKQGAGAFSHLWSLLKMKIDLKFRSEADIIQ